MSFLSGEIAAALARMAHEGGGALSEADLAAYTPGVGHATAQGRPRPHAARDPAQWPRHGRADGARHPRSLRIADGGPDSPEALHAQIEAMKLAFADIYRYVAEPGGMPSAGRPLAP